MTFPDFSLIFSKKGRFSPDFEVWLSLILKRDFEIPWFSLTMVTLIIERTGLLTKWCIAKPVMSFLQYSQTVFLAHVLFFSPILKSMVEIKILNSTALYEHTHNLATMFVCESLRRQVFVRFCTPNVRSQSLVWTGCMRAMWTNRVACSTRFLWWVSKRYHTP